MHRSNVVLQMSHQLLHLNFTIGWGPKIPGIHTSSNMFRLLDIGAGLNSGNMDYHQSFAERYPNLVLKFAYLDDMEDFYQFDISVVDVGK